jgi:hypothetical protein
MRPSRVWRCSPVWLESLEDVVLQVAHTEAVWRHSEKAAICKAGRQASAPCCEKQHSCEKINFCYLSNPVCAVLLWQPKQTDTAFP